jgi:hypothetical protein
MSDDGQEIVGPGYTVMAGEARKQSCVWRE